MELVFDIGTLLAIVSGVAGVSAYVRGLEARVERLEAIAAEREEG